MRKGTVSAALFLSDEISRVWCHQGTTLRYTEEKEHLHDLEALLGALERNKAYINCIIVGLEQFGAVWRFV